jgi:VRR-NUC domain.
MVMIKQPTEHQEQVSLIKRCEWNRSKYPELALLFAVPNGGDRNVIVASKLKAEGVKAGVPDLCLPIPRGPYHGLWIEMKKIKGSRTSKVQKGWIQALRGQGYAAEVAKGADEAWNIIVEYLQQGHPV